MEVSKRGRGRPRTKFGAELGLEMFGEKAMRFLAAELAAMGVDMNTITIEEATEMLKRLRKEKAERF